MNTGAEFAVSSDFTLNLVSLGFLAVLMLTAFALFVTGIASYRRHGTSHPYGWYVRQLSALIFMAGFLFFAWGIWNWYLHVTSGIPIYPSMSATMHASAIGQLARYMAGACICMILGIILGPPKTKE